jgi:hypothetical protein
MVLQVDFSRTLTPKEQASFRARQSRLDGPFGESTAKAAQKLIDLGAPGRFSDGLRIRTGFTCLDEPIPGDVSDRKAPPREQRPPATQIVTSQGAALRLYLTALAVAQISTKPGNKFINQRPLIGNSNQTGWDDLLASKAEPSGHGRDYASVRNKKDRSLRNGLETLRAAGLVHLTGEPGKRGRHDGFIVLEDIGRQNTGDPLQYTVPGRKDDYFTLPAGFVTNGWIHVLEDSEIAVLLMVACGYYGLSRMTAQADILDGEVAVSGEVRLTRYGIHRSLFTTARKTLDWFGLLNVREIDRWADGRGEDGSTHLHRLRMVPEAFERNALEVTRNVLDTQLQRSGASTRT